MRRSLVIYDFAPDPSKFPNIRVKLKFRFYQCNSSSHDLEYKTKEDRTGFSYSEERNGMHGSVPTFKTYRLSVTVNIKKTLP